MADGELVFSLEGEKDAFKRNGPITASLLVEALRETPELPDVIAVGGWHKTLPGLSAPLAAGYEGLEPGRLEDSRIFGRDVAYYSSSHERSHLFGGVALSPFDPDREMAILVWEGVLGSFYRWRGPTAAIDRHDVLDQPGARYAALFCLGDPACPDDTSSWSQSAVAGKLMALVGLADERRPSSDSIDVVESLLAARSLYPFNKAPYRHSALYNCGVREPEFCRAARYLSQRLLDTYLAAARELFEPGLPLVVCGGCGLNCDWNSAWAASGLFRDVFVPPVANDSGSAIGTAVDALVQVGESCTVGWDVYRGPRFVPDTDPAQAGWLAQPLDLGALSATLEAGAVVAWVHGRCEIGPRALGNRSLLASAADRRSHARLNSIKQREAYRPIAPVCLEEDLGLWFDRVAPDPHMLYFRRVRQPDRIPAVTHVDGSARAQSVTRASHPRLHDLLVAHRARTGIGVLCNTSLNFPGTGFINRTSELLHYCTTVGVDHVVIEDTWYVRPTASQRVQAAGHEAIAAS
ncbi:MAG TPA: carbamoyltransferase C-terminal domain-containing protein [Acidimicrobiales bacterium]